MKVDKAFANNPEAVDVYVVANAKEANCGLSFDDGTDRPTLNGAKIGSAYFGTSSLFSSVPADGLPMSAVLKNQPISGKFPTLRIGTESHIATLQLTRAVSKLRFVLCRITEAEGATKKLKSIDNISLDGNLIPTQSYLIPRERYSYSCSHEPISYGSVAEGVIPQVDNPLVYAYETQSAQVYEDIIDAASDEDPSKKTENLAKLTELGITGLTVNDLPQLKELGLTYFRESDKQLTGTIQYTNTDETTGEAIFSMAAPGDFLRNHSWIIYIYYMDSTIYTLTVTNIGMKTWELDPLDESAEVYNW